MNETKKFFLDEETLSFHCKTKGALSVEQAKNLVSKLMYSIEDIRGCFLEESTQDIVILLYQKNHVKDLALLLEKMITDVGQMRVFHQRTVKEHFPDDAKKSTNQHHEQVEKVFALNGQVCKDEAVELHRIFDLLFLQCADSRRALLRQYPSLIDVETMKRCKYIEMFPQNVFFVAEFPHNFQDLNLQTLAENYEKQTRLSTFMLSPAVCFHCYKEYQEKHLEKPLILTARNNCFRHEATWRVGKYRLREFSMREIVYLADALFIEEMRSSLMNEIWHLFIELGLKGRIETASDPFYFPQDATKEQYQLITGMKYELIVQLHDGESFALASFNNMRDTLCEPFKITYGQRTPAHSGCAAFGLDRWVYAILSEFGSDPRNWPERLREKLP
jgi:seryl-tRNA synthetase